MKYCPITRRQFLQGAGGALMLLPILPSLLPREALAQAQASLSARFLVHLHSDHGGIDPIYWRPNGIDSYQWQASEREVLYPGSVMLGTQHEMRRKRLQELRGANGVSEVFDSQFDPYFQFMNIIDGLGLPFGGGHHSGGYLGNYHGNDGRDFRTGIDANLILPPMPTIDQILAMSSTVYGANDPRTCPVLNLAGGGRTASFKVFNGSVQPTTHYWSLEEIYNYLFGGATGAQNAPARVSLVRSVYEDYQRLVSPNGIGARLSREDADAVEEHMQSLSQVERRLANIAAAGQCNVLGQSNTRYGPTTPTTNINLNWAANREQFAQYWSTHVDLIVTAIKCRLCRVFTVPLGTPTAYTGDYHQDCAHRWEEPTAQGQIRDAHRFLARHFVLPLLARLVDVRTADNRPLLDDGLVMWQHESSHATHDGMAGLPTMTAGSLGGFFKTGWYIDYRNLNNYTLRREAWDNVTRTFRPLSPYSRMYPGLPMNRWLHTLLEGFGVSRSEYLGSLNLPAGSTMYGYADHKVSEWGRSFSFRNTVGGTIQDVTHYSYPQTVFNDCNTALPFIRNV